MTMLSAPQYVAESMKVTWYPTPSDSIRTDYARRGNSSARGKGEGLIVRLPDDRPPNLGPGWRGTTQYRTFRTARPGVSNNHAIS